MASRGFAHAPRSMPPQNENTREALLRGCRGCLQAGREAEQDQAGESCTVDSESTTRRVCCPSRSPSSRALAASPSFAPRSEERRVGKEGVSTGNSRWPASHYKQK